MANHGWTTLKKKIAPETITSYIWLLDRQRFDGEIGHMGMYRPESPKDPYFWELPLETHNGEYVFSLQFLLSHTGRKFEWRHPPDPMLGWWLQQYIAEFVAYKLGGLIQDEGVDEKWNPDFFIKYPVVQDWVTKLSDLPGKRADKNLAAKVFIQDLENNVPKGLWRVVSHTNGFEKTFDKQSEG